MWCESFGGQDQCTGNIGLPSTVTAYTQEMSEPKAVYKVGNVIRVSFGPPECGTGPEHVTYAVPPVAGTHVCPAVTLAFPRNLRTRQLELCLCPGAPVDRRPD